MYCNSWEQWIFSMLLWSQILMWNMFSHCPCGISKQMLIHISFAELHPLFCRIILALAIAHYMKSARIILQNNGCNSAKLMCRLKTANLVNILSLNIHTWTNVAVGTFANHERYKHTYGGDILRFLHFCWSMNTY